jgi:imidazolonepropionase-like amidohydrolase
MLSRGFTSIRDTGGASSHLANAISENLIPGPRLFQCGKALSQTGGHGDFSSSSDDETPGCCGGHHKSISWVVDGVPSVLTAVRTNLKNGADFIKIMGGGGVASPTDGIETVQFSPEEIRAITESAWRMGKKMVSSDQYSQSTSHRHLWGVRENESHNI